MSHEKCMRGAALYPAIIKLQSKDVLLTSRPGGTHSVCWGLYTVPVQSREAKMNLLLLGVLLLTGHTLTEGKLKSPTNISIILNSRLLRC